MRLLRNQRGDTLVEVTMASVILAAVLIASFTLANRAFRQGASAQERSQAANLAQEQYEALRSLRDGNTWANFKSATAPPSGVFYMKKSGSGTWQVDPSGAGNPRQGDEPSGTDYTAAIRKDSTHVVSGSDEYIIYGITITWEPRGSDTGGTQSVEVKAALANTDWLKK